MLKFPSSKVATGKYCSDKSHTGSSKPIYFGPYNRLNTISSAIPQYTCSNSGDIYNLKAGLLTADEVAFAGGINWQIGGASTNSSYYLYNGSLYWTMSPRYWDSSSRVATFLVSSDGSLTADYVNYSYAVIPVINLNTNVTVTLDSDTNPGTSSNPYRIS